MSRTEQVKALLASALSPLPSSSEITTDDPTPMRSDTAKLMTTNGMARFEPLERGVDGLRGIVPVRADGRLGEVVPAKADYVQEPQRGVRDARVARVGVIELLELLAGAVVGDVNRVALQRPRFSRHRKRPIYL
ncbi:hypothetical protein NW198_08030 [Thermophilibacter sp. ET337]|uniref:hypothetical protein n=1 Tax=Thermophilibacter sp. ET337 TaxID=2973084 RepID=UPI0021AD4A6D|nr:hypothetical protein [Thermophilibacter sp. ET337]MCR8908558.1 hypothetical protein [Thermophilibacter sp. ET337]